MSRKPASHDSAANAVSDSRNAAVYETRISSVYETRISAVYETRISAMQHIGRALSSTLDLDELLPRIMTEVTGLMDAERSTLFLVDKKEIWSKVAQGSELKEIRLPVGQGIAGWVAAHKKLLRIDDAYADPRFDSSFDKRSGFRTRAIICAPIFDSRKRLLGVIQVLNKHAGKAATAFGDDDEAMLTALASQLAVAIDNARLYRGMVDKAQALAAAKAELERANRELDLLFKVERQLTQEGDVDSVLEALIGMAMDALGAEAGSILLVDAGTGELFFKSALGEKGDEVKKLRLKPGVGIVGHVAATGEPVLVLDPSRDKRHEKTIARKLHYTAHAIVCAPLIADGSVLGAFELLNKVERGRRGQPPTPVNFTQDDLKLLTLLAGQAARMITDAQRRTRAAQEERLQTIGHAMSGVIHDFRGPMAVVAGYTEILADEPDAGRRREMAEAVIGQVQHMNAMVGELLGFARGESALYKRKVYMNKFAEELRQLFSIEGTRRNAEIAIVARYDGVAQFDPVKVKRVLTNLVRNALESLDTDQHGQAQGKVTLSVEAAGADLRFSVKDNGAGIPEEIIGRLFESFVSKKAGGTGLGLAVCKKIVEDHGGHIEFTSKPGRGTTFSFQLPKAVAS